MTSEKPLSVWWNKDGLGDYKGKNQGVESQNGALVIGLAQKSLNAVVL